MKQLILLITAFFYLLPICYSQPGQPDPSFGNNGVLVNDGSRQYGIFSGLSIQKGKIVVLDLGFSGGDYVRRYNLNGTPDSTFSVNGKAYIPYNIDGPGATAIQQDGKIVVVSRNSIDRFSIDGQQDSSFNRNGGQRLIDSVSKSVDIRSVALQSDGKIVVAGMVFSGGTSGFGVYRFNSDGSADKSFSGDGRQKTTFDSAFIARSVVIQPDGKIVIGGESRMVRYNANGSLDNTFGVGGKLTLDFFLYRLAIQSDGKLIAAGITAYASHPSNFVIARFNTNGSPDSTFNGYGKQFTDLGEDNGQDVSVAIQNDGKILISGTVYHKGKPEIAIARYFPAGITDSSFAHDGLQETTGLGGNNYECEDMVILDDKVYVGGLISPGIISYLLGDSKTTRVQFTDPFYTQAFHTAPANINLSVKIINPAPGTTIKKVDFYKDLTLIYSDSTSPYNYSLKNVPIGQYSIKAKATDNNGIVTTSAVIPIEILPNQPPYIYLNVPLYNQQPLYHPARLLTPATVTFPATAYDPDPDGAISKVEFYEGSKLLYTDSTNPYAFTWNNIPVGQHSVTAKATDNSGLSTTYLYPFVFTVDSAIKPSVNITTPFDNQYYNGPLASVNIIAEANAQYPGGTIGKVDFYNGATLLNTDSIYPYSFTWNNVPLGSYLITAKATNSLGVSATSAAVRIFVVVGQSPSVKITSPARDTNFITPGPILLTAEASDPYTLIKSVVFYNDDSTLLFTENKEPFSRLWESVPTGSYHVTAVATDYHGLSTRSAPVHITVLHNRPPVVNITSPSNGATYTAPGTGAIIVLNADATAHGVKIKTVEFYSGTTLIGTVEKFPYSYTWNNVIAGNYTITAHANDTYGRTTISSPVIISVTPPDSLLVSSRPSAADIKTGLNEEPGLQLAPNPVHNILSVNTTGLQQNKRSVISIISASGVLLKIFQANPLSSPRHHDESGGRGLIQLNVSSLASGMYIIKMISADKVVYRQFIKM